MALMILSVLTLILCAGGALMESKMMDTLCNRLFEEIRGEVSS